jgi:hypothetical protein
LYGPGVQVYPVGDDRDPFGVQSIQGDGAFTRVFARDDHPVGGSAGPTFPGGVALQAALERTGLVWNLIGPDSMEK